METVRYARRERKGSRKFRVFQLAKCANCGKEAAHSLERISRSADDMEALGIVVQEGYDWPPLLDATMPETNRWCKACVSQKKQDDAAAEAVRRGFSDEKEMEAFDKVKTLLTKEKAKSRYENRIGHYEWAFNRRREFRIESLEYLLELLITRNDGQKTRWEFIPTVLAVVEAFSERLMVDVVRNARLGLANNADRIAETEDKADLLEDLQGILGLFNPAMAREFRKEPPATA